MVSAVAILVIGAVVILFLQSGSLEWPTTYPPEVAIRYSSQPGTKRIVAYGWIEGRTPNIAVKTRLSEQISNILVKGGDSVKDGDILLQLDAARYIVEEDLARAELDIAHAKLLRIQNGYRTSEIEAARNDYAARAAELEGAKKIVSRLEPLLLRNNVSQQAFDEESSRVETLQSMAEAARSRMLTMEAPPREDDLMEAQAAIAAARAHLSLAQLNLERTNIRSPIDGCVLRVNAELGELAQPDVAEPLVILSDVRTLRAVVEVDEFDALAARIGQRATITTDSSQAVLAHGSVVEIEPQMTHKQLDTSRPGARIDTFVRRVWVALVNVDNLPVGLPIEVSIELASTDTGSQAPAAR